MAAREFTHDYYAVLQVSEDADENTIKSSYKRIALRNHPDRNQVPNATAEFQKLQEAYEVLRDPHQRHRFNAQLSRIRRDAAVRISSASNRESYFNCNGQSTQLYEQSIYELERKLCDLRNESAKLHQDCDAKLQKLQKHKAAIQRLLTQDYEAAKEDDKRNTWMSFLTMNGYTRPEQAQRKRAATLRTCNRRDHEDIVRDLEAERDRISVKMVSLHVEISQIGVQK
ncbi:DnaJ domain containing protein [Beauveria bassiana ARSEF 2860]|uniref:DnaJ domain containing protein n=1 Tax=Beauveria bassiana (strain ARSEF 2860) TaxID=655819 RepID=J4UES4_BEAB2|nr:DnaJ domain containing protein [Beauveria bassiana ARSEF 2860]EJP60777.1 DnaJ domain containing protein [Beauveria bassiana ARSEF 2860]